MADIAASDAIDLAAALLELTPSGGTICIDSDIELSETVTIANTSITLLGDSPDNNWTISTSSEFTGSVFSVDQNGEGAKSVTLENLSFEGTGDRVVDGIAWEANDELDSLTLANTHFRNFAFAVDLQGSNQDKTFSQDGTFTCEDSSFTYLKDGVLLNGGEAASITNCDFTDIEAQTAVLSVAYSFRSLTIADSYFGYNDGNATVIVDGNQELATFSVADTDFVGNIATDFAGALDTYDSGGALSITDSTFVNNSSSSYSGAVSLYYAASLTRVEFTGNVLTSSEPDKASAILGVGSGPSLYFDDVTVQENGSVEFEQPAIRLSYSSYYGGQGSMTNSTVTGNLSSGPITDLVVVQGPDKEPANFEISFTAFTSEESVDLTGATIGDGVTYPGFTPEPEPAPEPEPEPQAPGAGGSEPGGIAPEPEREPTVPTAPEPNLASPPVNQNPAPEPVVFTDPATVTPEQIAGLTPEQVATIEPDQFRELDPATFAEFTAAQVAALPLDLVRAIRPARIEALTPEAVQGLSGEQLSSLRLASVRTLTPVQVSGISVESIVQVTPSFMAQLKPRVLAALKEEVIVALSPEQVSALRPAALAKIPAATLKKMAPEVIGALRIVQLKKLTTRQISGLTRAQKAVLTPAQRRALA